MKFAFIATCSIFLQSFWVSDNVIIVSSWHRTYNLSQNVSESSFIENSGLSNNMGIQLQTANLMETLWFRGKDDTNLPQHPGKLNHR